MERPGSSENKSVGFYSGIIGAMIRMAEKMEIAAHHALIAELKEKHARESETEARHQAEELKHFAEYDPLTGALSSHGLEVRLPHLSRPRAILLIDGTNVKAVNDTLGHDAGNQVIDDIHQTLRAALREEDLIARIGGDEFVVVLGSDDNVFPIEKHDQKNNRRSGKHDPASFIPLAKKSIAERIELKRLEKPLLRQIHFDLAVGGAVWDEFTPYKEALEHADRDMYAHKSTQPKSNGEPRVA